MLSIGQVISYTCCIFVSIHGFMYMPLQYFQVHTAHCCTRYRNTALQLQHKSYDFVRAGRYYLPGYTLVRARWPRTRSRLGFLEPFSIFRPVAGCEHSSSCSCSSSSSSSSSWIARGTNSCRVYPFELSTPPGFQVKPQSRKGNHVYIYIYNYI